MFDTIGDIFLTITRTGNRKTENKNKGIRTTLPNIYNIH